INILVIFFAPEAFGMILGKDWIIAGDYARWIAIWTVFHFVAFPLSSISYTHNKQKVFLWFQIVLLILRIAALIIGGTFENALLAVALFSVVSGLFNLITSCMYIYIESGKKEAKTATAIYIIIFCILLILT